MAVMVEFTISSDAFPFGRAVSGDPKVKVSLEQVIPLSEGRIPFIWATDDDLEQFEEQLRSSPIVASVEVLTRIDDSVLYFAEWRTDEETFLNGVADAGGTILEAHGDSEFSFTLRFQDHADLSEFHRFYQEQEFPVRIERVYTLDDEPDEQYGFGLTPAQRNALIVAVQNGYFRVPRDAKLEDIADELDISRQAASEHIRRGANKVLRKDLVGLSGMALGESDAEEDGDETEGA